MHSLRHCRQTRRKGTLRCRDSSGWEWSLVIQPTFYSHVAREHMARKGNGAATFCFVLCKISIWLSIKGNRTLPTQQRPRREACSIATAHNMAEDDLFEKNHCEIWWRWTEARTRIFWTLYDKYQEELSAIYPPFSRRSPPVHPSENIRKNILRLRKNYEKLCATHCISICFLPDEDVSTWENGPYSKMMEKTHGAV